MKQTFTQDQIPTIATLVLKQASTIVVPKATVIALSGELGAGKTTLTQEMARTLGIVDNIISPTFVIMKSYAIRNKSYSWKTLIHIDAYRLDSSEELFKLGWRELSEDKDTLIILEWPEKVPECLDDTTCRIKLTHQDEETREIAIMV